MVCVDDHVVAVGDGSRIIDVLLGVGVQQIVVSGHFVSFEVWDSCLAQLKDEDPNVEIQAFNLLFPR